jgi:hypothetical protein
MFGQTVCTEQADIRSDNLHRAGGCSVKQFSPNRRMFGQTIFTEQADVRSDNLHRTGAMIRNKAVTYCSKVINLI